MNRLAIVLLSLRTLAQGQNGNYSSTNPAPTQAFFTLPFLPTLPAFYQPTILPTLPPFTPPTLPSLIMTFKSPVAVRVPLFEEMQEAIENSFNNVSTNLNNLARDNQDKLNSIVKGNQDSLSSLVKSGQDNINTVAKLTQETIDKVVTTPGPVDLSQFTLIPLPPARNTQARDGNSDEADVSSLAPTIAPPSPKIESIRKVGRYYVENLTPQHVLDILAFKKPLLTPAEFTAPTHPSSVLSKVTIMKREPHVGRPGSNPSASHEVDHDGRLRRLGRQGNAEEKTKDASEQQPPSDSAAVGHVPYPVASVELLTIYMLWKTPTKHTAHYKRLLLALQIWSGLAELHMGALFAPVALFPLIGVYSKGLLSITRIPPHYSVVLFYFLVIGCLTILNLCVFYRHQAILPADHPLKIKRFRNLVYSLYAVTLESVCISVICSDYEQSPGNSEYLQKNHPAMMWIMKKESWIVYDSNDLSTRFVVYHIIFCLAITFPLFFVLVCHIYAVSHGRVSEMSFRTLAYHRAMTKSLIMQSLCWLTICMPVAVLIASFLLTTLPHAVTSASLLVAQFFPLLNAIAVILSAPSIRHNLKHHIPFRSPSLKVQMIMHRGL